MGRGLSEGQHAHLYRKNRWKVKSERFRKANPLCAYCLKRGKVVASQVADHATPHKGEEDSFWYGKLVALCKPCHDSAKKLEEFGKVGFDAQGDPITPTGGWV